MTGQASTRNPTECVVFAVNTDEPDIRPSPELLGVMEKAQSTQGREVRPIFCGPAIVADDKSQARIASLLLF
jgi:hypothetical protein